MPKNHLKDRHPGRHEIDEKLLVLASSMAGKMGISLAQFVNQALQEKLSRHAKGEPLAPGDNDI